MRIVLVLAAFVLLSGCGASGRHTDVVAAFYPLAYVAQTLGGPSLRVQDLTPAGAEPHDIELTPQDVVAVQRARVVLYLSHGFQPALSEAVRHATGTPVDVLQGIDLHAGEGGKADPHVWLDPVLFSRIVRRVGVALGRPRAAAALIAELDVLDHDYRAGLAHCARRDFVTSHAAFGYLSQRYGLHQVAITGIDPQSEPSAQKLASLVGLVRRLHVSTIFFERLVSPKLAQTLARETGAKTAVLDPIEGLTHSEAAAGATYLSLMRQNLAQLRRVLGCS